jgi:hypothetical protein
MAIDRIPGVGPQNTDIATAVAAAVPTIAAITSSITTNAASAGLTNASITSAGNAAGWGATGPTTTQIAAAVPTLAQITSAITTNAASAGVTNASIAATVAASGAPWGGTITPIAAINLTSGNTYTVSGLSGYKNLRLTYSYRGGTGTLLMRLNGDTGSNYQYRGRSWLAGTTAISFVNQTNASGFDNLIYLLNQATTGSSMYASGWAEIYGCQAASPKLMKYESSTQDNSSVQRFTDGSANYISTAGISSITIFTNGTFNGTSASFLYVDGIN